MFLLWQCRHHSTSKSMQSTTETSKEMEAEGIVVINFQISSSCTSLSNEESSSKTMIEIRFFSSEAILLILLSLLLVSLFLIYCYSILMNASLYRFMLYCLVFHLNMCLSTNFNLEPTNNVGEIHQNNMFLFFLLEFNQICFYWMSKKEGNINCLMNAC